MNKRFAPRNVRRTAILALIGAVLLTGQIRLALWIVLGGLAAKTAIANARARSGE